MKGFRFAIYISFPSLKLILAQPMQPNGLAVYKRKCYRRTARSRTLHLDARRLAPDAPSLKSIKFHVN